MDAMDWVHCRSPSIVTQNGILCADDLTQKLKKSSIEVAYQRHPRSPLQTNHDQTEGNKR